MSPMAVVHATLGPEKVNSDKPLALGLQQDKVGVAEALSAHLQIEERGYWWWVQLYQRAAEMI